MSTFGVIVMVIIFLVLKAKRMAGATNTPSGQLVYDEQPSYDYDEPSDQYGQPVGENGQPFGDYFSYETEQPAQRVNREPKQPRSSRTEQASAASAAVPDEAGVTFDLRQAVIAQTILHNDYIDDRY